MRGRSFFVLVFVVWAVRVFFVCGLGWECVFLFCCLGGATGGVFFAVWAVVSILFYRTQATLAPKQQKKMACSQKQEKKSRHHPPPQTAGFQSKLQGQLHVVGIILSRADVLPVTAMQVPCRHAVFVPVAATHLNTPGCMAHNSTWLQQGGGTCPLSMRQLFDTNTYVNTARGIARNIPYVAHI